MTWNPSPTKYTLDVPRKNRFIRFYQRLKTEYKKHGWYMDLKTLIKISWKKSKSG